MKLLIIDDDPEAVESVELTVAMTWPEVTTVLASSGGAGILSADSDAPDLAVLEIDLPDMDGFMVCQEIRRFSEVPIVMVSSRSKEADILRGLQVGADDYIIKPLIPMVFLARMKAVMRRSASRSYFTGGIFEYGDLSVDFGETKVTLRDRVVNLTLTEYKILWRLIKSAGKIVPNRTLLGQVWGRENLEDTHYLKVHIKHLREKLGDQPAAPKYIFNQRSVGYRFAMKGELASS